MNTLELNLPAKGKVEYYTWGDRFYIEGLPNQVYMLARINKERAATLIHTTEGNLWNWNSITPMDEHLQVGQKPRYEATNFHIYFGSKMKKISEE